MLKTKIVVGVSDARFSSDCQQVVATHSLGSCIAVTLYDRNKAIGGMLHFQLPDSKMNPDRAMQNPYMYADSGMRAFAKKLANLGADVRRMEAKIAGGAAMATGPKGFDIGKRNHLAIRKIFWKSGMTIDAEDVGGLNPRNMYLDIENGTVTVRCNGIDKVL